MNGTVKYCNTSLVLEIVFPAQCGQLIIKTYNAPLSGKKLLAKIVNGVKQPTVFCPFERLVSCLLPMLNRTFNLLCVTKI